MNHLGIQDVVLSQWFAKVWDLGWFFYVFVVIFLGKGNGEPELFFAQLFDLGIGLGKFKQVYIVFLERFEVVTTDT